MPELRRPLLLWQLQDIIVSFLSHNQDEKLYVTHNPRYYVINLHLKICFDKHITFMSSKDSLIISKWNINFGIRKYWKFILKYWECLLHIFHYQIFYHYSFKNSILHKIKIHLLKNCCTSVTHLLNYLS